MIFIDQISKLHTAGIISCL